MENLDFKNCIAELEARLFTAEKYINAIVQMNNITVPSQTDLDNELATQRTIARKKYGILP